MPSKEVEFEGFDRATNGNEFEVLEIFASVKGKGWGGTVIGA
jgi:hypothetical protein